MRLFFLALLISTRVFASSSVSSPIPGQLIGEPSNGAPGAGNIGENITSTVASPGVSITNNTSANVTSIALTPGDWDVSLLTCLSTSGCGNSQEQISVSSTSATLSGGSGDSQIQARFSALSTQDDCLALPSFRVSLSSNTTYYSVVNASVASTCTAYGRITAVRTR